MPSQKNSGELLADGVRLYSQLRGLIESVPTTLRLRGVTAACKAAFCGFDSHRRLLSQCVLHSGVTYATLWIGTMLQASTDVVLFPAAVRLPGRV